MLKAETEIKFPKSNSSNYNLDEYSLEHEKTEDKETNENMQLISIEDMPWYKKIFIKLLKIFKLRN